MDEEFVISTLQNCEREKCWKTLIGDCIATCGYTGPGVGILLTIFIKYKIFNKTDLDIWFTTVGITQVIFSDIINETIGNLFDIGGYSPIANVHHGIRGLIVEDVVNAKMQTKIPAMSRVYLVEPDLVNLKDGPNIISFVSKYHLFDTFHHATLYIDTPRQTCTVFSSWCIPGVCIPLTARTHPISFVKLYINLIIENKVTMETIAMVLNTLFSAPKNVCDMFKAGFIGISVVTVNPEYLNQLIGAVFTQVIEAALIQHRLTNYGGKFRKKRNKKTRKLNKKYKKYKKNMAIQVIPLRSSSL